MNNLSVKTKLYILIIIVITPLFVLQALQIHRNHDRWIEREIQSSQDFVGALSRSFMNYLEKIWYSELAVGKAIDTQVSLPVEHMEDYLGVLEREQKMMQGYCWVNEKGLVVASTTPELRGAACEEKDWFKRIFEGEERVVGSAIWNDRRGGFLIPVARAIRKGKVLRGAVVGFLDAGQLGQTIPTERSRKTSCIGLVDRDGNLVYRSGKHTFIPEDKRKICKTSAVWEALQTGKVVISDKWSSDLSDENRIGINYPVKEIGWVCFVTVSVDEILAGYRQDIYRHIITLILIVAGSVVAAGILARWISRPVESLKIAAESISDGDLAYRAAIKGHDEIAAAGEAFNAMAERIQQLEANRKLFLQTSAHELKNPMASIKGLVTLITRRIESGMSPENLKPMLGVLDKEVDRLAMILNQILDAFKTQEGKLACEFVRINLIDVIKSAMNAFQFANVDREVSFESETDTILVKGDFVRLEDVLRNLLGNARKYSPSGSPIQVIVKVDAAHTTIAVRDQGIGIPPAQLKHIFEGFVRGTNLEGHDPGGMGLGLYICRDIVLRHGGEIWAENNPDRGSTFFIRLPLLQGQG